MARLVISTTYRPKPLKILVLLCTDADLSYPGIKMGVLGWHLVFATARYHDKKTTDRTGKGGDNNSQQQLNLQRTEIVRRVFPGKD